MIKIEVTDVYGWEATIRGMRNPMNSWGKSDSEYKYWCACLGPNEKPHYCTVCGYDNCSPYIGEPDFVIGPNDLKLMQSLSKAGPDHGKFLRMIDVTCDITAPLYWWKEFDTYKVGTVANSCSTMHKIHDKEFTLDDFSHEHLDGFSMEILKEVITALNIAREDYLENNHARYEMMGVDRKFDWWQMIQLLPSSYNQKRTVQLNYQVLKSMYFARRNHKLDEWHDFCAWCETLPYFKEICIQEEGETNE